MPADWRHQDYRWCIAMAQNSQNEQRRRYSCIIETTRVGNVVCSTSLMLVFWRGRRKALLFCGSKIKSNVRMALHSALCCGGGFLDDRNWNQQNEDIQLTCMLRMHNNLLLLLSTAHPIQFTQFSFRCCRRRCRFAGSFQYISALRLMSHDNALWALLLETTQMSRGKRNMPLRWWHLANPHKVFCRYIYCHLPQKPSNIIEMLTLRVRRWCIRLRQRLNQVDACCAYATMAEPLALDTQRCLPSLSANG